MYKTKLFINFYFKPEETLINFDNGRSEHSSFQNSILFKSLVDFHRLA